MSAPVNIHLQSIRDAFHGVSYRVTVALRTQVGDAQQLDAVRDEVILLLRSAQDVSHIELKRDRHSLTNVYAIKVRESLPPEEYRVLQTSVENMILSLDEASSTSAAELPEVPPSRISLPTVPSGLAGRPRKEIDASFLKTASQLRTPKHLAAVFGCSARTIRRRMLNLGISQPGAPVFVQSVHPDGSVNTIHTPTPFKPSDLTDDELDTVVHHILETFPHFGRQMIMGHLTYQGHSVTRERVRQSYVRVHGVPPAFGRRRLQRRTYKVAGPNALWHHDGQHG